MQSQYGSTHLCLQSATSAIVRECPADIYDQLSYSQEEYQTALYIFLIDMCSMDVSGSYRHDDTNVYGF